MELGVCLVPSFQVTQLLDGVSTNVEPALAIPKMGGRIKSLGASSAT